MLGRTVEVIYRGSVTTTPVSSQFGKIKITHNPKFVYRPLHVLPLRNLSSSSPTSQTANRTTLNKRSSLLLQISWPWPISDSKSVRLRSVRYLLQSSTWIDLGIFDLTAVCFCHTICSATVQHKDFISSLAPQWNWIYTENWRELDSKLPNPYNQYSKYSIYPQDELGNDSTRDPALQGQEHLQVGRFTRTWLGPLNSSLSWFC